MVVLIKKFTNLLKTDSCSNLIPPCLLSTPRRVPSLFNDVIAIFVACFSVMRCPKEKRFFIELAFGKDGPAIPPDKFDIFLNFE